MCLGGLHVNRSSSEPAFPPDDEKPRWLRRPIASGKLITFTFSVDEAHAYALYSAIEDISDRVGRRLQDPHRFAQEEALTYAAIALAVLRRTLRQQISSGDPDYA